MGKLICLVVLHCLLVAGNFFTVQAEEASSAKTAFSKLSRLRLVCLLNGSYEEYSRAFILAREHVHLVHDFSSGVDHLSKALSYYERALLIWQMNPSLKVPVESLRVGVATEDIGDCTAYELSRATGKHFQDVVLIACLWNQAAEELDEVPASIN